MPDTIDREFYAGAMTLIDAIISESRDQEIGVGMIPVYDAIQQTLLEFSIREESDSDIIREVVRSVFEKVEIQRSPNCKHGQDEATEVETTT